MPRCPGQDMRYWKPEDIFDVKCPYCDFNIEFWKDEPFRLCKSCGKEVRNPRIDLGCAKWCKFANECLGKLPQQAASPVLERLLIILSRHFGTTAEKLKTLECAKSLSGDLVSEKFGQPAVIISSVLLAVTYQMEYIHEQRQPDVIPGTIFILEDKQRQVLGDAGVDAQSIENVIKLVKHITADKVCDLPQYPIVSDIYTIIKQVLIQKVPLSDFDTDSLLTNEAKDYIKYRSGELSGYIAGSKG